MGIYQPKLFPKYLLLGLQRLHERDNSIEQYYTKSHYVGLTKELLSTKFVVLSNLKQLFSIIPTLRYIIGLIM